MISSALTPLLGGKNLTYRQAYGLFDELFSMPSPEAAAKTVLALLARKGETADEVRACVDALAKHEPKIKTPVRGLIDTCGTGGDQSYSINISTLSAIVAAGAGCKVAKHGNRAFSSRCGSSDLMESLGVKLEAGPVKMIRAIQKSGFGYFHAPFYHPAISRFQKVRKELKIRTIFNLLGPLTNPVKLEGKLVGVANKRIFDLYLSIFKKSGIKKILMVHSPNDGMDEISCSAPSQAVFIQSGKIRHFSINPQELGLKKVSKSQLESRSLAQSKKISLDILQGKEKGPILSVILINAGAAIWVSGRARNLQEGIQMAGQSISTGRAYQALKGLIRISKS